MPAGVSGRLHPARPRPQGNQGPADGEVPPADRQGLTWPMRRHGVAVPSARKTRGRAARRAPSCFVAPSTATSDRRPRATPALAVRAEIGRALGADDAPDRPAAHAAGRPVAPVDVVLLLEIARLAVAADEVAQRA